MVRWLLGHTFIVLYKPKTTTGGIIFPTANMLLLRGNFLLSTLFYTGPIAMRDAFRVLEQTFTKQKVKAKEGPCGMVSLATGKQAKLVYLPAPCPPWKSFSFNELNREEWGARWGGKRNKIDMATVWQVSGP